MYGFMKVFPQTDLQCYRFDHEAILCCPTAGRPGSQKSSEAF